MSTTHGVREKFLEKEVEMDRPIFSDDVMDEYSDNEMETEVPQQTQEAPPSMYSAAELSLSDPLQPEFTSHKDQKLLTKLHLEKMEIDQNRKYSDSYYRRDEYKAQYQLVVDFIDKLFVLTEDLLVQELGMRFDEPNVVYEFIQASQPCIYFTVSARRKPYETLRASTSEDDEKTEEQSNRENLACWPLRLKTCISCATMVGTVVDNVDLEKRVVFWIKIDMAGIKNENYRKTDPRQLQSLTITKDVYPIVQQMIMEAEAPPTAPPKKSGVGRIKINVRSKPSNPQPKTPLVEKPCDPVTPPISTSNTKNRVLVKIKPKKSESLLPNDPAEIGGVKRKLDFTKEVSDVLPDTEPTAMDVDSPPKKKRKMIQDVDESSEPKEPAKALPGSEGPEKTEKKKLINEFQDLMLLFRAVISANLNNASGKVEPGGDSTNTMNSLIFKIRLADESSSPEKEEESRDMELIDITNFMNNTHSDTFRHTMTVKKEAIIHALICWLKIEVHNHLSKNAASFIGDIFKDRNPIIQAKIFEAAEKSSVSFPVKQTKRNARLAEVFPFAFLDFFASILQVGNNSRKGTPISPVALPLISCFSKIYEWRNRLAKLPTDSFINIKVISPKSVSLIQIDPNQPLPKLFWIWEEDKPAQAEPTSELAEFRSIINLDPSKFDIIQLHMNRQILLIVSSNERLRRKAPGFCEMFVNILNHMYTIVHETIPNFIRDQRNHYNNLMERIKKDCGPTGLTPNSAGQHHSSVGQISPNALISNFEFWFITGTTTGALPSNEGDQAPFHILAHQVRQDLFRELTILSYAFDLK